MRKLGILTVVAIFGYVTMGGNSNDTDITPGDRAAQHAPAPSANVPAAPDRDGGQSEETFTVSVDVDDLKENLASVMKSVLAQDWSDIVATAHQ